MTRCRLCHIHATDDDYGICAECRGKAKRGFATFNERIEMLENPQPVTAVISGEPDGVDFVAEMGWK